MIIATAVTVFEKNNFYAKKLVQEVELTSEMSIYFISYQKQI